MSSNYCFSIGHVLTCKCQINLSIATLVNAFTLPDTYGEVQWWDLQNSLDSYLCSLRNIGVELVLWKREVWQHQVLDLSLVTADSHMMIPFCTGWLLVPWMPATVSWSVTFWGHFETLRKFPGPWAERAGTVMVPLTVIVLVVWSQQSDAGELFKV